MRLAPVALFFLLDRRTADFVAREQSRLTHGAPQAIEACSFFLQVLQDAVLGHKDALSPRSWAGDPAIKAIAGGAYQTKTRSQISSSGYVVDTLEAALWSISQTTNFEAAVTLGVNLAGDADTVGAVTGQLAGAIYGVRDIPGRWLDSLAWQERLQNTATALLSVPQSLFR